MKVVRILDIEINTDLLKTSKIAQKANLSQSYVSMLLNPQNERNNTNALQRIRNAAISLNRNAVRFVDKATKDNTNDKDNTQQINVKPLSSSTLAIKRAM